MTAEAANLIDEDSFAIALMFTAKSDVAADLASYIVVDAVAGTNADSDRVDGTGSFAKITTGEKAPVTQPDAPVIKDVKDPAAVIAVEFPESVKAGDIFTVTVTLEDLKNSFLGVEFALKYDDKAVMPVLPADLMKLFSAPYVQDSDWESLTTVEGNVINFAAVNAQQANAIQSADDFVFLIPFVVLDDVADGYCIYISIDDVALTTVDAERVEGQGTYADITVGNDGPDEPSSEEPSSEEPSSEEPSAEPSVEPSSEEPSEESSKTSPETGDFGVAAIALLALVTAGGVFAVRKFR